MSMLALIRRLRRDRQGTMAIETALVASTVALMALGSFQVSSLVARYQGMQAAAADAQNIALAARPNTQEKLNTVKSIIMTSTGLPDDKVTVSFIFRCGDDSSRIANADDCDNDEAEKLWTFVRVQLNDTYTPIWSNYGIGSAINLSVDRTVQIS